MNTDQKLQEYRDILIDNGFATSEEIDLIANIFGYTIENLKRILFVRTGYRNFDQLKE